jgi:DNA processing protein
VVNNPEQAAYVHALSQLKGVGPRAVLKIVRAFPDASALLHITASTLAEKLDTDVYHLMSEALANDWARMLEDSRRAVERHLEKNIVPIPITEPEYPALLRLISDPPSILYVKGSVAPICKRDAVAIVGTRHPTRLGEKVTWRIARAFVRAGYAIVSGLAQGIDTFAHRGAIDAGGVTVAVLGTSVDKIYPVENKDLADQIVETGGALVSELPVGAPSSPSRFVQRDRIQSGLCLAVIAVQTDLKGGTMHTVRFAEDQGRLLLCPTPVHKEAGAKQYRGIRELLQSGKAKGFEAPDYPAVLDALSEHKRRLLGALGQPAEVR